ncbi:MAG TPA: hypothetical protein VK467_04160 [Gemmatimonadales bacterium]|nr:hypothetical protein [Gemmatimonadales bacterium]
MNLEALLADCYRRCGYAPGPPSEIRDLFTAHVNDAQQELAADPALQSLLRASTTFTSAPGVAEVGLPPTISRVWTVRETTNNRRLFPLTRDSYRMIAPDPAQTSGTADHYVLLGPTCVAQQPAVADDVFVLSTDVLDTGIFHAEVVTEGGFARTVTLILAGQVAVSLGLLDIIGITDWYLDEPALGVVTLHAGSGAGPELGRIGIEQTRVRYQGLALLPTPSDARVYLVEYERIVSDLVSPADAPAWLPDAFQRLLSIGARRRYWEDKREADRYTAALAEWNMTVARLKAFVNNPPDQTLIPGRGPWGRSDLGGAYPASTIFD